MLKETVSGIMLSLLLISTLMLAFSIQPVKAASGTIYIRADGSVDPSTAPIQRDGDIYTLTDNAYDEMVVERSNITIDGNGYVLQGFQAGYGLSLSSVNGVVIRNVTISNFDYGIYFKYSSNNIIAGNHITANKYGGIHVDSPSDNSSIVGNNIENNGYGVIVIGNRAAGRPSNNNTISGNNITANNWYGVDFYYSSYSNIVGNNIENNGHGVCLEYSSYNSIVGNNIENNGYGVDLYCSSYNSVVGNNITANNEYGVYLEYSSYSSIVGNNIENNEHGVCLEYSSYNSIAGNSIADSEYGVYLEHSPYNNITGNNIENNGYGVDLYYSFCNSVVGNNITANNWYGVYLSSSSYNSVAGNNITANNWFGVYLLFSSNNSVVENNIENSKYGVYLHSLSCNVFHWNNLVDNQFQAYIYGTSVNVWDDGYPSGGNYWSDYTGIDEKWGPNQDLLGSDGIGDIPYVIDANNTDRYPLKKPHPWASHDVGITAVNTSKTVVGQGNNVSINVMLFNYGNNVETLNVTLYAGTTILDKITNITLPDRNFTIATFTWNTSGFVKGNYTIWAYACPVFGETDTTDNTCTGDWVVVTIPGDVDGNFEVGTYDVTAICLCYDSKPGDPNYYPNCDLDGNGVIDIFDVTTACITYGQKYPYPFFSALNSL